MIRAVAILILSVHCIKGWYDSLCPVGYYGQNCSLPCGHCSGDGACVQTNGICFDGCLLGYTGLECRDNCPSNCGGNKSCSATNQFCTDGCNPGYSGFFCNKTMKKSNLSVGFAECSNCVPPCESYGCFNGCLNGFYGLECNIRCGCSDGTPCEQKTGTCLTPRVTATLNPLWVTTDSTVMTPSKKPAYIYTLSLDDESNSTNSVMIGIIAGLVGIIIIMVIVLFYQRIHRKQNSSSYESPIIQQAEQPYTRPREPEPNSYLELDGSFTNTHVNENDIPYYSTIEDLRRYLPTESTDPYIT